MKLAFHVHTNYSHDGFSKILNLKERLMKKGIDIVAISDHNTLKGAVEAEKLFGDDVRVIKCEEIKTQDGEIIGLFLSQEIPPLLSIDETIKRIKYQGGLVCVPHPFDRMRKSKIHLDALYRIIDEIDIVEVSNARNIYPQDDKLALDFADKYGKLKICGTDAHILFEIGHTYVELEDFKDSKEFLNSLKDAKLHFKRSGIYVHFFTKGKKYYKLIIGKLYKNYER
ncbi:PHP domain-containing protein [Thermoanaerobacterium thermosaccharolyticum]|uniref:PHP domain-containing protein n=1 Tax=Thermoanaerobacterium thermosaccharolyticum TaxID=1517 RepID=UPI001780CCD3|nr:PHP domain-containing protein [Thermoanaerobacterium thermosaccharolyticum]MBE0067945.1 phosphotransferase [Thermoanaerobacterium thermosaccharolyticum]MBE0227683.1 phosphotransferase [Thermoanaerobacterium thermosaccharolyticum]